MDGLSAFFADDARGEAIQAGADAIGAVSRGENTQEAALGHLIIARALRGLGRL